MLGKCDVGGAKHGLCRAGTSVVNAEKQAGFSVALVCKGCNVPGFAA